MWGPSRGLALRMARKWHFVSLLASHLTVCSSQLFSGSLWKSTSQTQWAGRRQIAVTVRGSSSGLGCTSNFSGVFLTLGEELWPLMATINDITAPEWHGSLCVVLPYVLQLALQLCLITFFFFSNWRRTLLFEFFLMKDWLNICVLFFFSLSLAAVAWYWIYLPVILSPYFNLQVISEPYVVLWQQAQLMLGAVYSLPSPLLQDLHIYFRVWQKGF